MSFRLTMEIVEHGASRQGGILQEKYETMPQQIPN